MNRLEKLINNNRDEFDDMIPSEKSWQRVEASLMKKTVKRPNMSVILKWSAAAAVLIMITTTAIVVIHKNGSDETGYIKKTDPTATPVTGTMGTDEGLEMNQFAKLIAGKQQELKLMAKEQPVLYQKFTKDITQLDSSYNTLKNKLSITPNREMLMEAMIQNLELQLNVLNQQLSIIHQIKQTKNHEKNKSFT